MKKDKKVFHILASLFLLVIVLMASTGKSTAATKNGLYKEDGVYHYYKSGNLVKSQWVTIKTNKYYFNKKGAAMTKSALIAGKYYVFYLNGKLCRPDKTSLISIDGNYYKVNTKGEAVAGWNKDKTKYCKKNGMLCTGIHVINDKFYAFKSNGIYNKTKSTSLRNAAKRDQSAKKLLSLLGSPIEKKVYKFSCYCFDKEGHDEVYYYKNVELSLFKGKNGEIILEDYMTR